MAPTKSKGLISILSIMLPVNSLISKEVIENVLTTRLASRLLPPVAFAYAGKVGVSI